jgi:hypothetical protein
MVRKGRQRFMEGVTGIVDGCRVKGYLSDMQNVGLAQILAD